MKLSLKRPASARQQTPAVAKPQLENSRIKDFSKLVVKPDPERRPLWVIPTDEDAVAHVFLETFSPIYEKAYDFVIAIAEPVCRPEHIHEYHITAYSLYTASSLGLSYQEILETLERFSKNELDLKLKEEVRRNTERCGKVKLLLRGERYFIESVFPEDLHNMLTHPDIAANRIDNKPLPDGSMPDKLQVRDERTGYLLANTKLEKREFDEDDEMAEEQNTTETKKVEKVLSFEIDADPPKVALVREAASKLNYFLLEEYDFMREREGDQLPIQRKPGTEIRPYQARSLSKMFGANGRARSGIIVLPCGAGKTLVGILAATTIKKSTLVLCSVGVAVEQWAAQFTKWTTLPPKYVCQFTSVKKQMPRTDHFVLITTYSMMATSTEKRSAEGKRVYEMLLRQEWGLVILDEVQVVPAKTFRRCISETRSRCKLGLTATLVREDDKIADLVYMIGPKLYEANWIDLQRAGYLASVQCVAIWCDMTRQFYAQYLKVANNSNKRKQLYHFNPNKLLVAEYLKDIHEARGDKVLIFADNISLLTELNRKELLGVPAIHGKVGQAERLDILTNFQTDDNCNCILISKVGDNAIDLPDVNVIIQITSQFGSRRQEAQRLGRILRPKSATTQRYNAFFYTLVSKDTKDVHYARLRQRFLVAQGYSFKILQLGDLPGLHDPGRLFAKPAVQADLFDIATSQDFVGDTIEEEMTPAAEALRQAALKRSSAKRAKVSAAKKKKLLNSRTR